MPPNIREDFPIFENYRSAHGRELIYLDSAASSQTPRQVVEAMDAYYYQYRSNVHRSSHTLGIEATDAYEDARSVAAAFIGAEPWEVFFTPGATLGVNTVTFMLEKFLKLGQRDEIAVSMADHHSNLVPFQELAVRTGARMRLLPLQGTDLDFDGAEKLISAATKIVAIPLASNVLGPIYDARRIVDIARRRGAVTVVDATTAIGHMEVNINTIGCDFLFFSGHKILGPTGIGIVYGREELLNRLEPGFTGGGTISRVTEERTTYRDIPKRFEPGTQNIAGAIGLAHAIQYLEKLGTATIARHSQELVRYALEKLNVISGVSIFSEKNSGRNVGIVSFVLNGVSSQNVAEVLGEEGIAIRSGYHCAMPLMDYLQVADVCRASFYVYNRRSEIDALAAGIRKARKLYT